MRIEQRARSSVERACSTPRVPHFAGATARESHIFDPLPVNLAPCDPRGGDFRQFQWLALCLRTLLLREVFELRSC